MKNLYELSCRNEVPVHTKYKPTPDSGNVVNYKKEKLYDYYKCDFCGAEIEITNKKQEMIGGIAVIPQTLTGRGNIKLALCNKCLNPVIREFENTRNRRSS